MRVLVLGGDGYLGWPTAMRFAAKGHQVLAIDNYLRRRIAQETCSEALIPAPNLDDRAGIFRQASGYQVAVGIGDCTDYRFLARVLGDFVPDVAIHYAEQPSAPYSMKGYDEARTTLQNNLLATFNLVWAVLEHAPACHIVKLGTMGEYGTPNIDIEEGWLDVEHKGRRDRFLFPRAAGSLYHTTKVLDTDLLWFYVRVHGLSVTDLMQGPVYGLATPEADVDPRLAPNFHYDDIFGTVVNRFLVQAVAGVPLTVYGKGGQTRGYLDLLDTLQCVELAAANPPKPGELRILNQFTETFSVNQIAERVRIAARAHNLAVTVQNLPNPRQEKEEHYYNPAHSGLLELGLQPHPMTTEVLAAMIERVLANRDRIDTRKIMPRVRWS
ncbi:MAG: NAD-dependent epimerase/dehydratase family protein [Alphaproteobacteria bacterium]